ncbi:kinase-like protein [Punctularia strigosozonata HHB-11173 SS5]|uniref:kinase-like protein n=1 Tax=Punctularia strigosozonata (strain HHB-11173) TaxID=741275 RepID=UPI00044170D0|nr:kinase-like protein [Punctularia strigosozonata HHB-11173 SS5]EIN06241.1 kinase-like protein [Punctularia strigosozonata HHB-11173 SS5]
MQPEIDVEAGQLYPAEVRWAAKYEWLLSCGYRLRDRYKPDWVPSWRGKGDDVVSWEQEDAHPFQDSRVADAVRVSDNTPVALKRIYPDKNPQEEGIIISLGSEPLASDSHNHCVPIYEILSVPDEDYKLIVMPLLRKYADPEWDTMGEVVSCIHQVFEGLQFMHANRIAHRDCTVGNIMLDPRDMYPDGFHPSRPRRARDWNGDAKFYTRTQRPSRYYLIDFGLSQLYPPEGSATAIPSLGGDKTVPELLAHPDSEYDPFPVDVYYVGNWVREYIIKVGIRILRDYKYHGFEFLSGLMDEMTVVDPSKRPTMDHVMGRLDEIVKSTSSWTLRSRVVARGERPIVGLYRAIGHWKRRVVFIVTRTPAIPTPAPAPPTYVQRRPIPSSSSSTRKPSIPADSGADSEGNAPPPDAT